MRRFSTLSGARSGRWIPCRRERPTSTWFLVNLSRLLGFFPGNGYAEGDWFDVREGLYTPLQPAHGLAMNPHDARILRDMVECDVRCLAEIGLNRRERVDFLGALLGYYGYHLDAIHAVRSVGILREVF